MMRVSGWVGRAAGLGLFGSVTESTGEGTDGQAALGQPWHRVNPLAAAQQHLEVQMRAGGVAAVADGGDLVAGHHPLTDTDHRRVDVTVERDRAVGMAPLDP